VFGNYKAFLLGKVFMLHMCHTVFAITLFRPLKTELVEAMDSSVVDLPCLYSLFAEILSKEVNCTEIQFREDGSWRAMKPDSDEYLIPDSPSAARTKDTNVEPAATAVESCSATGMFLDVS